MCGCKKNKTKKVSLCRAITVSILNSWKAKFECSLFSDELGIEYKNRISNINIILTDWINYKTLNPEGCDYNENLREVQVLINYIKTKHICQ